MESDKRVVRVVLGGQELAVEVPTLPVDERAVNRKGGLVYSELYHVYFRGPDPTVAARMGPHGLVVLCGLLVEADWRTMVVRPDRAALARMLGISESCLREQLGRLASLGVIAPIPQAGGVGGRGRRRAYAIIRPTRGGVVTQAEPDLFSGAPDEKNPLPPGRFNGAPDAKNPPPPGEFRGVKPARKQAETCQETDLNPPPPGGYIRTTNDITNTTTRSSSLEKNVGEETERLSNLFFSRRKDRRIGNTDQEVMTALALWLQSWTAADIAAAIKESDWADNIGGVGRAVRSRPTRATRAARKQRFYRCPYSEPTEDDIARNKAGIRRIRDMLQGRGASTPPEPAELGNLGRAIEEEGGFTEDEQPGVEPERLF